MKKIVNIFVLLIMLITIISCEIVPRNNPVIKWVKYIDETHFELYGVGDWGYIHVKTDMGIYEEENLFDERSHKITDYEYVKRKANHFICEVTPPFTPGETVVVVGFGSLEDGVIGEAQFTVPYNE